jgi:hypothetical protein
MAFVRIEPGPDDDAVPVTQNEARARALERDNNILPWRIDMLSDGALEALDGLLDHMCHYPGRYSKEALAGAFLLQAALVTGRTVSRLVALPIMRMEPSELEAESAAGLYIGRRSWAWWLEAGRPSSRQDLPDKAKPFYRGSQQRMLLGCGERTRRLLQIAIRKRGFRLVRVDPAPGSRKSQIIIPPAGGLGWTQSAHRQLTSACLDRLPPAQRHALSARRIERWLFQRLIDETGEAAIGAIVTGNVTTQANAMVHYTWLSAVDALSHQHAHAARYDLISRNGLKPPCPPTAELPSALRSSMCGHGSRYVLTETSVQRLVFKLQRLASSMHRSSSLNDLIRGHNAFTLYSLALIGFGTGLRPGVDPIPHPRRIDLLTGLLVWNDKDRQLGEGDRLLWLPEAARDQIVRYYRHLEALRAELERREFPGTEALRPVDDERQSLFLLSAGSELRRSGPKEIAKAFDDLGLPIRLNVWRHYLRTALVGKLPGDVLMAFLGHWQRGQNPWDTYSALDPSIYIGELSQHLPKLLQRDGWSPLWGLGAPPPPPRPQQELEARTRASLVW